MRQVFSKVFLFLILLATTMQVNAQCAMCRAVAENGVDEAGYGVAAGLNNGILFIMAIPYVLLTVLFLVFFRKRIKGFLKSFNNIH